MLLILALILLAWFNVKPQTVQAAGSDAGVISVTANGDSTVTATLYGYAGSVSSSVSFYRDGDKVEELAGVTVAAGKRVKATSTTAIVLNDEDVHYYTVVISEDDNWSNNNRTLVRGKTDGTTNPPVDPEVPEDPKAAKLSVSCLPVTVAAGDTVNEITVQVSNTGDAPATNIAVTATVDNRTFSGSAALIAANASADITLSGSWTPGGAGSYPVSVSAAADGGISAVGSGTVTVEASSEPEEDVKSPTISDGGATFTTVTLTWGYDAVSDGEIPTEYIISIDGRTITRNAPGTQVITGLRAGTSYPYTVTAKNDTATSVARGTVTTRSNSELVNGADLVVSDIIWDPANPVTGDQVAFSAVITNQGDVRSSDVKHGVRFYIDNEAAGKNCASSGFYWSDEQKKGIEPGQSVVVSVGGSYLPATGQTEWTAGAPGSHTVTAYVDDSGTNATGDVNTGNNYLTKTITVRQTPSLEIPEGPDGGATVYTTANAYSNLSMAQNITVTVNNQTSAVFLTEVNNARYWDWRWKDSTPTTIFELKEETGKSATVRIKLTSDVSSAVVRPLSSGITAKIVAENGEKYVQFDVTECGNYTVEFNGKSTGALQLFVNPPYSEWHNSNVNGYTGDTYVGLGEAWVGVPGFGGHVYGSGVVINNGSAPATTAYSGAKIEGVTLLNTHDVSWEVQMQGQSNITFDYFHIVASGSNSDGISIQGSSWITITNSYIRTWDDCVVLKNQYSGGNTHDVTVDRCVFWSDLAQAMEIGAETNKYGCVGDPQIYNAVFKNCTVIHAFHKPAMSIHNMDNARIHGVTWENIVVEDAQMGNNGGDGVNGDGWPLVIDITNVVGGELPGTASSWSTNGTARGSIYDITFKNIQVVSWQNDTGKAPGVRILNSEWGGSVTNVKIQNLTYGNTKVTDLNTLQSIAHCQFTHLDAVPGSWPSATQSSGHDNSYGCRGSNYHASENFDTNNLTILE